MTIIRKNKIKVKSNIFVPREDRFLILNMGLFFFSALLILFYVLVANGLASRSYEISKAKQKIAELTEENSILASSKLIKEDLSSLEDFARTHNMVKVQNSPYLFQDAGVALRR